jgi:hypothetical protein
MPPPVYASARAPHMESDVLTRYTVDLSEPESAPTESLSILGGGYRKPLKTALVIAVAILVIIILVVVWRRIYRSKPDCGRYRGGTRGACSQLSKACDGDPRCLNAVAHCMPVIAAAGGQGHIDAWGLNACSRAIRNMSPRFVAQQLAKHQVCLPPSAADVIQNPRVYGQTRAAVKAAAPLLPYAVDVAHNLPPCHAGV